MTRAPARAWHDSQPVEIFFPNLLATHQMVSAIVNTKNSYFRPGAQPQWIWGRDQFPLKSMHLLQMWQI